MLDLVEKGAITVAIARGKTNFISKIGKTPRELALNTLQKNKINTKSVIQKRFTNCGWNLLIRIRKTTMLS